MAKTPTTAEPIIADSSGLVSLASSTDHNHRAAVMAATRLAKEHRPIIVPAEVFSETMNLLGKLSGHAVAWAAAQELLRAGSTFVYQHTDETVVSAALVLFQAQPLGVSYTDCVVMATADALKTTDIFGFDQQFADAGYTRLVPSAEEWEDTA